MRQDAFSKFHPLVNFLYFLGAIGFGVVIQHPAYAAAGCVGALIYYLLLHGKRGIHTITYMLPLAVLIAAMNPLFNTDGRHILFFLFGRPYTLEALYYGLALAAIFVVMMLWFGCYNVVLTSDKFTSLFGSLIPSLSLLLVMVLRLIPNFLRKAKQIIGARRSIGRGEPERFTEKVQEGMTVLSALTDWALEGGIVTGDSMRARGYGAARRSSFQIYRMTIRDWIVLVVMLLLGAGVLLAGGTTVTFTPDFHAAPLTWGFAAYCAYLLIPTALHVREAMIWHILRSKI